MITGSGLASAVLVTATLPDRAKAMPWTDVGAFGYGCSSAGALQAVVTDYSNPCNRHPLAAKTEMNSPGMNSRSCGLGILK